MPPRVFIVRHGETEWSRSGRHTGITDLPLTEDGEKRIRATARGLVGNDRLIVPEKLKHVYVSPRSRAQGTLELLNVGCRDGLPWLRGDGKGPSRTQARVEVTEAIREWDYGEYEGLTSREIRDLRAKHGQGAWDIWREGCPGGESPQDVVDRLDSLVTDIRTKYHTSVHDTTQDPNQDVLIVAHGHILRAFAMRWVGKPLTETAFILEAGGVGTLSYEHRNIHEPAILLGGAFVVE